MSPGELLRVRLCFAVLGAVPVLLIGWLGYLQIGQAGTLLRAGKAPLRLVPATADREYQRQETLPSPRGSIVDRRGRPLAMDREVYEVRAVVSVPKRGKAPVQVDYLVDFLRRVADGFALALANDSELADRNEARKAAFAQIHDRLRRQFRVASLPTSGDVPAAVPLRQDVAIARDVDTLEVIESLRELDRHPTLGDWLQVHLLAAQTRHYNEHEATYGIIGQVAEASVGLESVVALEPLQEQLRNYRKDGRQRGYFLAPLAQALKPNVLHSTLDLDLQRFAARELASEAARAGENGHKQPLWAAMVLLEIATGDVLAAAQWHRDSASEIGLSCTPYQSLYEPGSIVKPLVAAYALDQDRIDWDHVYDCARTGADYRSRIAPLGRAKAVEDDHDCHELTPHGILVNSSNIGACFLGLELSREQWREYMRFYGFGESLGLPLPNEPSMSVHTHARHSFRHSFDEKTPLRRFYRDSAISFSFGYEFQVTALQMARAYLRLLRGAQSELRLCRGMEQGDEWLAAPVRIGGPRLRPEVVHRVQNALIDVVADEHGATGQLLVQRMKKELGVDLHGMIAGKTGTAVSTVYLGKGVTKRVRNASFVGVMPAQAPKWLAVCILQRDDDAKFYGGSYAAPPVVRLLLRADQLTHYRASGQEPVNVAVDSSQSPGASGWGRGAPEKSVVGR